MRNLTRGTNWCTRDHGPKDQKGAILKAKNFALSGRASFTPPQETTNKRARHCAHTQQEREREREREREGGKREKIWN